MEYWTIMWITIISGTLDGKGSFIVYPSFQQCEAALNSVSDTLSYDHQLECEETHTPSKSLRPKRRPEGLGQ